MNYLSTQNIQQISFRVARNIILHPTSIAYIQILLEPYARVLDTASSVKAILDWIPLVPLKEISMDSTIVQAINDLSVLRGGIKEGPEFVELTKGSIINRLIKEIIDNTAREVTFYLRDNLVLPWDIKQAIWTSPNYTRIVGITDNSTLPVTFLVSGNSYTYEVSIEFTFGLLLYMYAAGKNIEVKLFTVLLNDNYLRDPRQNRFTKLCSNRNLEYTVEINRIRYCFYTTDFMQGFSTGALWFSDDHHQYWTNLISYQTNPNGDLVTF